MAQADQKRSAAYSRAANRRKLVETIGFDTITYRLDEDDENTEFHFPHPMMYDRETKAALKPLAETDTEAIVRVLLGDQFDRFIELDGDPDEIMETAQLVAIASQKALREGTPLVR